ncbi:MAG: Chaperone protein DnaJ [candidate division WS2 bacterium]|nr:Chaperone protein DnaJ [Candidatus Lithacetigena glycinireducens]
MKDYYAILNIPPDAEEETIKKSYRELVKQYHPDLNKNTPDAAKKMTEVNEAYETLSDPEKRRRYDALRQGRVSYGDSGGMPDFGGFDFGEGMGTIFEDFFEVFRGRSTTSQARPAYNRGADIEVSVEVTLRDVLTGVNKQISVERLENCDTCKGKGTKSESGVSTCSNCKGTGYVQSETRTPFGVMFRTTTCPTCQGEGKQIKNPCQNCKGTGTEYKRRQINVEIPAGIEDGMRIRLSDEGHKGKRGGTKGDLYIRVNIKSNPLFTRQGKDLINIIQIPYYTAILGGEISVNSLEGPKKLNIRRGTQHKEVYTIKGNGLPDLKSTKRGDLKVVIEVNIPKNISSDEEKLLKEITRQKNEADSGPWWKV